ncbi:MAG: hydrogenase maturation nickel metallochaperone HypA [Verrucomicrobia bacterium]|nr:hydrogenase maturation nickel metallochaperone HypA [Verrucomicrobiota bacterium]
MHEVHLVRAIVETVESQAAARGARQVARVRIRCNPLTSHSADHVRFSFDVVKQESRLLRNATLELTEVAPLVRCVGCGFEFQAGELPDLCPKCESADLQPVNPTEMVLESFEIQR